MDLEETRPTNNQLLDGLAYQQHALEASVAASNQNFHDQIDNIKQKQQHLEAKLDSRFDSLSSLIHKMDARLDSLPVQSRSDLHSAALNLSICPHPHKHNTQEIA
ncbi:hypothetical protein TSUD_377320 [Trifolium subterraneum]|uniref:Uncharacterized protein n=1 Tax=Trifolium subterraneum TaxID=3900 RepID=A0A2Z6NV62_TRISU|nr:hypothetical protein TSUD_377320 [Trifolium subterraneum]